MTTRRFVVAALCVAAVGVSVSAQEIAVGGRVLVPGGSPLPEADVVLLPLRDSLGEAADVLDGRAVEPVGRAITDAEGRFRLLAPGAGLYRVRVTAAGFVDLEAELAPLIEPRELPDAELRTDEGLTLRVVDAEARPVNEAAVRVVTDRPPFSSGPLWQLPARRGVTAQDGTLRLPRAAGERIVVSVFAAGHPYHERSGLSGTSARLRLGAGPRLEVLLEGSDGRPVAGALAVVEQHPVGRTDERGRVAVHAERGRSRALRFLAPDGRRVETRLGAEATAGEPRRVLLPDRLVVSGRLIDAKTRRGVEGALVWDRSDPAGAVRADRGGGFALGGPAGRILEITAGAPGYLNARSRSFQLSGDGRPGPTLVLEPAAAIEGTVVDDRAAPVAGATVELSEKRASGTIRIEIGGPPPTSPRARTNAKGQFRLGPVDPEKSFDVEAHAEGFAPTRTVVRDLEPYRTRSGVRIQLARGQSLVGRVVDLDGQPLPGAALSVAAAKPSSGPGMLHMMSGDDTPSFDGTTDTDGRFEIRGIPAGRYDVAASRSGFAKTTVPAVELKAGDEPVDLGDIALEPGERLQGLASDPDGKPIEGVEIHVSAAGGPMMMMVVGPGAGPRQEPDALTDPGGFFQVDDLRKDEPYNLSLRRRGYVEGRVTAVQLPRPELVEVTLEPASDVTGRVLDPEGQPIVGAQVSLSRSTTIEMGGMAVQTMMMTSEQTDAAGRFLFEDQRPGTISLAAVASGWREAKRQDLEIPQGEDLEVDLPLEPGSVVEGQVFAPDGRPAIGASVSRVGEGPRELARLGGAPTDGNGYFRLEGLEPGRVSIEATHPDYPRVVRDVELDVGVNALTLHFRGGQEVSGVVLDVAGNAVPGATVSLVPVGRYYGGPETVSRGDGTFTMPGVQDGDYSLRANAEGYAEAREPGTITVAGEPLAGLEVRLERGATIVGQVLGLAPEEFSKVGVSARGDLFLGGNSTPVDFEGRFRIENTPPGAYTVVGQVAQSGRQAREKVVVEPGMQEIPVQLQFGGGLTLSGRAVQGERPIGNAIVYSQGIDVDHDGWNETDLDGRFRVEGLQPGRYRVQLQHWQTGLSYKEEVALATSREIELRVPTAQVRGTVVDSADRQPLAGVTVTLESADPDQRAWRPARAATSDMDGRFTLDAVGDGNWKLAAAKQGYAAATRELAVQSGRDADDLRLSLDPTEGLTLEVRLPTGAIPEELQVAVLEPSGSALTSGTFATGENGRVRLSTVPAGTWDLVVGGAGSATTSLSARAPGPPIPVQLQPACSLQVRVPELQSGEGVAQVSLRDANGRAFRDLGWLGAPRAEWRMTDGRIDFRSLPPGSWTVNVAAQDGRNWQATTSVAPGAPTELVIE